MRSCNRREKQGVVCMLCILTVLIVINTPSKPSPPVSAEEFEKSYAELATRTRFTCTRSQPSNISAILNSSSIINALKFSYSINSVNACVDRDIQIVMPVHSAVRNFQRRERIRKISQGQFAKDESRKALLLFFVGLHELEDKSFDREDLQNRIEEESEKFGDIIQINYIDTYPNLVYKSLAVLQWISQYCSRAEYVVKTDDDVLVVVPRLLTALYKAHHVHPDFILGDLVSDATPLRSKGEQRFVPENEYSDTEYPPFAASPAMGYPTLTGLALYQQALRTKLMRLHDVFLTGICAKTLGIPVIHDRSYAFVHRWMRDSNLKSSSTTSSIGSNKTSALL